MLRPQSVTSYHHLIGNTRLGDARRENVDGRDHRGRRPKPMHGRASDTSCSLTSPATPASCPASRRSTGSTSARGIPAAYSVLSDLLDAVIQGVAPEFDLVKLEGDAVFAVAPAGRLDGQGDLVLEKLEAMYGTFVDRRTEAIPANDHVCTACPAVAHLDLKAVLHRGPAVRQTVGSGSDLLGPAVTVAHRLLKNTVRERTGLHPYLFMTDAAATALGLAQSGISHEEAYPDVGQIHGRVVALGGADLRAAR